MRALVFDQSLSYRPHHPDPPDTDGDTRLRILRAGICATDLEICNGRLGLLCAQVLRNAGCPVRVIGKHAEKLALCERWSIRSRPLGDIEPRHDQDVVVDCTGSSAGFELAMQMVRPRGTIVLK